MGRSCRATKDGLEKANKALQLKGWTQEYLAGVVNCTRQTVIKFFARRPVEKRLFQAMCIELKLEWGEIAELEPIEEQASRSFGMDTERGNTCEIAQEERSATKVLTPPVSLVKNQNVNCKEQLVITFTGDIETLQKNPSYKAAVLAFMQAVSKDVSLTIEKIEKGSIKITFSGSPEGLKRLEELITSGELTEVRGMPVENVQLLTGVTTEEDQDKIRLVQEIITQGAKGRDLSDADLSGVDLSDTDLSNADLSCADLRDTDLRNANLENADFNCADLRGTNLSDTNLNRVSLHDSVIDQTTRVSNKWRLVWEIVNQSSKSRDLSNADLSGANLSDANLSDAYLSDANLSGADLSVANLSDANLSDANLSGANLSGANLSDAYLSDVNLSGADLSGANLSRANLSRANLNGADLSNADLSDANLSDANLSDANLSNADLSNTDLSNTDLSNTDLSDANLSDANLSDANLSDANLSRANLSRANLSRAVIDKATTIISKKWYLVWEIVNQPSESRDLSNANLSRANLSGANLRNANLSRANLSGANLRNADLSSAILSNADLSNADLSSAILRNANLRNADLSSAIVKNARFGWNSGLNEDMKPGLIKRGAIFEDSLGDRSEVLTPV